MMTKYVVDDALNFEHSEESVGVYTYGAINQGLSGKITKLHVGDVEVVLETSKTMIADEEGLIHNGFLFNAANYAAMMTINHPNVVLVTSKCQFLFPIKLFDKVVISAKICVKRV